MESEIEREEKSYRQKRERVTRLNKESECNREEKEERAEEEQVTVQNNRKVKPT